MSTTVTQSEDHLATGYEALATGDWPGAREAFASALTAVESPEALDGLGRALWWLREERDAVVHRERAYAGFRRDGELARAARIALWLSREYALAFGNEAAASGWLARAERLLRDVAPGAEQGWLDLARSEHTRETEESARLASAALDVALTAADTDLELRALAQLGFAEVSLGKVDEGLEHLDEAMAAATSGEPTSLETFADVCCTLMLTCERAGDAERPQQWSRLLEEFVRRYDHVTLLAFCRTCCADVFAANGRVDAAEEELVAAIRELTEAGQRSRCVHPAARLAQIRVLQGRFDEAEELLDGFEDDPDAIRVAVAMRVARGEARTAEVLLARRLDEIGWTNLLSAPLLEQLVQARLADDRVPEARDAAEMLAAIAGPSGRERVEAAAALALGRVASAAGDADAVNILQQAVNGFARLGLRLEVAQARLELARALADQSPPGAIETARHARNELEALGASREADAAAALMRSLGARGRAGPRSIGSLSRRETEVLRLLGEGLSNHAIADRLFISPKTAEHHVSRIFGKLGLKSRAEAAAYSVRKSRGRIGGSPLPRQAPTREAGGQPRRESRMSEQNKELVRKYYDEVINGRNLDAVVDYFADERIVEGVRRGCFSYFTAFPDLHVSLDELIAEGDAVFLRSTMTGTHDGEYKGIPPTGRHIATEAAEVFRIGDGKFVGYWCLTNVAGLMRQITEEQVAAGATA